MEISFSLSDINKAAAEFWQYAKDFHVIAFNGGLGAGKTTFTRALCNYLSVEDIVSSPTFSLINEYHFKDETGKEQIIFHSDWYRLQDEEEAIQAGIEDMLAQKQSWCIIEWAERASGLLPENILNVDFFVEDADNRIIRFAP
ncbi:tRNA (adenosine(37)-N6)-threonylcarbamoyltransferase complex ATPase subunit type 1 TsaE [Taibaiella lutea]|uniref:tRNA threonylcarbamoyladenosine biosynthesis protein TsaE n=1 Tax=Taibaiella lutea TaxID=2608001 RepID=A0A5M6CKQ0_9BACT|nr:tRNA (adenosine(37)-N6)-threonylcarbamoyltransferase complex ATPase subunit type 1 TsaE [Taibaiella lutea]KAA5535000.1 tRNA (adenosine(37)-N6)-threonylcarbamoyltransferase complex ATPase subunit type 1 TsaE [Taibaiella lutea]